MGTACGWCGRWPITWTCAQGPAEPRPSSPSRSRWESRPRPTTGERAGAGGSGFRSGLAQQVVELGLDVDVVAFLASRDDLIGPVQEGGHGPGRRLEVRLDEGGGQLEIQ